MALITCASELGHMQCFPTRGANTVQILDHLMSCYQVTIETLGAFAKMKGLLSILLWQNAQQENCLLSALSWRTEHGMRGNRSKSWPCHLRVCVALNNSFALSGPQSLYL